MYKLLQLIKINFHQNALLFLTVLELGCEATPLLRSICPTWWIVRNASISSVLQNYSNLIATLKRKWWVCCKGKWITHTNGIIWDIGLIWYSAHVNNFKAKDTSIQEATRGANLLITHYQSLCAEPKFDQFYELSTGLTDEPSSPRYRKRPRWLDGVEPHHYQSPKERYRHILKYWNW